MENESIPNLLVNWAKALATLLVFLALGFFVYHNATTKEATFPFKLGLDLAGGSHLVYEADVSEINPAEVSELMNVLRDVIERRINIFGVSEPIVQVEKSSAVSGDRQERLIVELPGVTDVSEAVSEIGKTPLLEFKLYNPTASSLEAANLALEEGDVFALSEVANELYTSTGLTGRYLQSASLEFAGQTGGGLANEPIIALHFNTEGADLFAELTRDNVGGELAIFLDGQLISAPRINEAIEGGNAIISGGFNPTEAKELAENLNFGALPVPIELVSTETIGASLGESVLSQGLTAGLYGFVLVILFMVGWYRLPGLIAGLALLFYLVTMLALFQFIPVTLTAAGLAGFILSLGMAVDANVLVFERLKEEFRSGKPFRESAHLGFSRAWSAIRDGNITSLLSAIILFWFGTSMVKGFALVFGLGVLVSMLTALTVTRSWLLVLPDKNKDEGFWGKLYNSGLK
ncbi:protein translocase subunit SecD [bacterium]|nr:protein translocase subunit SecD [bacterium]